MWKAFAWAWKKSKCKAWLNARFCGLNTYSAKTGWYWYVLIINHVYAACTDHIQGAVLGRVPDWWHTWSDSFSAWEKSPKLETSWLRLCQKSLEPCRSATPNQGRPSLEDTPRKKKKCCNCERKASGICTLHKPQPCNQYQPVVLLMPCNWIISAERSDTLLTSLDFFYVQLETSCPSSPECSSESESWFVPPRNGPSSLAQKKQLTHKVACGSWTKKNGLYK